MKLSQDLINFIEKVGKTGQIVNIDNLIIEPGSVRAIDDDRTVVVYQNTNVPEMPFGSIGLTRVGVFLSRLEIVKTRENYSLDVVTREGEDYALSISMRGVGTKIDYRCADPRTIQAPKQINDDMLYRVQINAEAVSLLQKGLGAMGSDSVSLVSGDGVAFELTDINGDVLKHIFAPEMENLEDVSGDFSYTYPVKTLLALFKQNPTGYFEIGGKGVLKISINDIDIYVLPQV